MVSISKKINQERKQMSKAINIKVPKPCHENWNNMTPKEQGHFCDACQKVVVDFTVMSDKEMLDHISKAAGQSVCGRFANDQLNGKVEVPANKRRFSLAYVWNLLLATVLFFESCNDTTTGEVVCEKPAVQQGAVEGHTVGMVPAAVDTTQSKVPAEIKGKVFNVGTSLPVAGAEVYIVGSKQKAVTDSKGRFSLTSEDHNTITLEVSAQNFFTKTVQLNSKGDWEHVKVMLAEEAFIMGEIAVDNGVTNNDTAGCKKEKQ
jgi:hypothetical protein